MIIFSRSYSFFKVVAQSATSTSYIDHAASSLDTLSSLQVTPSPSGKFNTIQVPSVYLACTWSL